MKKAILTLFKAPKAMQKSAIIFSSKKKAAAQGREKGGANPLCIGVIVIGGESVTV